MEKPILPHRTYSYDPYRELNEVGQHAFRPCQGQRPTQFDATRYIRWSPLQVLHLLISNQRPHQLRQPLFHPSLNFSHSFEYTSS